MPGESLDKGRLLELLLGARASAGGGVSREEKGYQGYQNYCLDNEIAKLAAFCLSHYSFENLFEDLVTDARDLKIG